VNASIVAEERGIKVNESLQRKAKDFASMIRVRTVTGSKESEVAGALFGRRDARIVRINGFNTEAIPKGHILFLLNRDIPGVLGRWIMRKLVSGIFTGLAILMFWFSYDSPAQSPKMPSKPYDSWKMFGGNSENTHYSTLKQINRDNVNRMEVAWTYDTGDAFSGSEMQCNPIIVDGLMYATTPKLRVI